MTLKSIRVVVIAATVFATPVAAFAQNTTAPNASSATDMTATPTQNTMTKASTPDATGAIGDNRDERGIDFGWLGLIGLLGLAGLARRDRSVRNVDTVGMGTAPTGSTTRGGTATY